MKKILIGAERSAGTIEEGKRKIEYDKRKANKNSECQPWLTLA